MRRILRKTRFGVRVTYEDGDYTNNLQGAEAWLSSACDSITLGVDMSVNERTRNKQTNTFLDSQELAERVTQISTLRLDDAMVSRVLAEALRLVREPTIRLELNLGLAGKQSLSVEQCELSETDVLLRIAK